MKYGNHQRPRRRSYGLVLVLLFPLIVVVALGYFIYGAIFGEVVNLSSHPLVAVESCSTVYVIGSEEHTNVRIKADSRRIPAYDRVIEGDGVYIKGSSCWSITLYVPAHTDLKIIASSRIEVVGVRGEMDLQGGTITLLNTTFEGESKVSTSRPIFFQGTVARQGILTIASIHEAVDIELPKQASFHLEIKNFVLGGPIISNYEEITILKKNTIDSFNDEMKTQVGSNPEFTLIIDGGPTLMITGI